MWEYGHGRGTKESYGGTKSEIDDLSPAQQFALAAGIEKAKIIRSSNFETVEFRLEDFKHLKEDPNKNKTQDDDDEDNVA